MFTFCCFNSPSNWAGSDCSTVCVDRDTYSMYTIFHSYSTLILAQYPTNFLALPTASVVRESMMKGKDVQMRIVWGIDDTTTTSCDQQVPSIKHRHYSGQIGIHHFPSIPLSSANKQILKKQVESYLHTTTVVVTSHRDPPSFELKHHQAADPSLDYLPLSLKLQILRKIFLPHKTSS